MTARKPRFLVWVDSSHALKAALQPQSLSSGSPLAGKGQNPWSSPVPWLMAPPLGLSFPPQWRHQDLGQRSRRCGPRRGLLPSFPAASQSPSRIPAFFEQEGSLGSIYQTGMHPKLGQQNSQIQQQWHPDS